MQKAPPKSDNATLIAHVSVKDGEVDGVSYQGQGSRE